MVLKIFACRIAKVVFKPGLKRALIISKRLSHCSTTIVCSGRHWMACRTMKLARAKQAKLGRGKIFVISRSVQQCSPHHSMSH